jgi:hypothetical protein
MSGKRPENFIDTFLVILLFALMPLAISSLSSRIDPSDSTKKTVKPNVSYSILIDTDDNVLYLLKNGVYFKCYSCASGKNETPSPLGNFKIVKKSLWGEGFGGYYLGLNCPWGTYGIHGTTNPDSVGSDSSHGCFRMYNADVGELYGYVGIGTPVYIEGGCYGIFGSGFRKIGPGMFGGDVRAVQTKLKELGYYHGSCNGKYEAAGFVTAIHKYQKAAGLPLSDYINKTMYASLGFIMIE